MLHYSHFLCLLFFSLLKKKTTVYIKLYIWHELSIGCKMSVFSREKNMFLSCDDLLKLLLRSDSKRINI